MRLDTVRTKEIFYEVRLCLMLRSENLQHGGLQMWADFEFGESL